MVYGSIFRAIFGEIDFRDPGLYIITSVFVLGVIYTFLEGDIPIGGNSLEALMFAGLLYGGGLLAFQQGFSTYRRLQLIRNTPTSKIRSMAMGTVEVKGKAYNGADDIIVKSPFSGTDCLFYRYTVEEWRSDDDGGHWVQLDQGRDGVRFLLKDETGEVIVDPEGAELELPADNTYNARGFDDAPPEIQNFIERNENVNKDSNELLSVFDNRRRYKEWYVTPEEELYIFGYAAKETDKNGEYEVIKDHESVPMFLISDKSEKELKNQKGSKYKLMIVGGTLIAPAGLALMFFMTGIL